MLFAQQQFAEIAAERIAHIGDEKKRKVLGYVDAVLNHWRDEQADADGMVKLPLPIVRGLLAPTLAQLAKGDKPTLRRVPVDGVEPHECVGGHVACPSDLLLKLWGDKYPPAVNLAQWAGLDVVVAALIERDAATMPIDSLAYGIRLLWMFAWFATQEHKLNTHEHKLNARERELRALSIASAEQEARLALERVQREREAQLSEARDASKATRAQKKKQEGDNIRRYVADEVKQRPGVDTATLTAELWANKERFGITSIRTEGGLKRRVATERTRALKSRK